jgi:RNA polymerase sigma-70 factor, ECF subfamily
MNLDQDSEYIRKAQNGNLEAFNHLVLKYQDLLYNHAYACLGLRQSAEDTTQESVIKAFQKIRKYQGGSFRSWLLKIVTNSCCDELRRLKLHPVTALYPQDDNYEEFDSPAWLIDPNISVMSIVERNELSKTLVHFINELPSIYRSVITLVDLYEMDYGEAADILKIPLGTLKSRLARARFQMKKKLKTRIEPSPNSIVIKAQLRRGLCPEFI